MDVLPVGVFTLLYLCVWNGNTNTQAYSRSWQIPLFRTFSFGYVCVVRRVSFVFMCERKGEEGLNLNNNDRRGDVTRLTAICPTRVCSDHVGW